MSKSYSCGSVVVAQEFKEIPKKLHLCFNITVEV